jgi:hypothetical protein
MEQKKVVSKEVDGKKFVAEYLERMKSQAGKWTPMGYRDDDGGL